MSLIDYSEYWFKRQPFPLKLLISSLVFCILLVLVVIALFLVVMAGIGLYSFIEWDASFIRTGWERISWLLIHEDAFPIYRAVLIGVVIVAAKFIVSEKL